FFAPRHNLLAAGRAVFIEGKYTDRGKWRDGWETRRRRGPEGGADWCIIWLGIPGAIRVVSVDATHFRGNHPAASSRDAAQRAGGVPLATSDQFFSEPLNLIMPGPSHDMGDGWETRRRRGPGHDWVVLRLGRRGVIERVDLDTTHFKGNFPESASLEGCDVAGRGAPPDDAPWRELVARTTLRANARHRLAVPPGRRDPLTHVRLNIFPDGGVARLRVWGRV